VKARKNIKAQKVCEHGTHINAVVLCFYCRGNNIARNMMLRMARGETP